MHTSIFIPSPSCNTYTSGYPSRDAATFQKGGCNPTRAFKGGLGFRGLGFRVISFTTSSNMSAMAIGAGYLQPGQMLRPGLSALGFEVFKSITPTILPYMVVSLNRGTPI